MRPWLRPGLLGLHALAVVAVVVCVVAGLWQLGVYDQRQAHERADRQEVPRVALDGLWGPDAPFEARLNQRPVSVEGKFAPSAEQLWVVDQVQDGRTGAWLVAPLITRTGSALLVVRGWAEQPTDPPPVPSGEVQLDAVLQPGQSSGLPWNPDTREIGAVRIPALTNELPYDLYSGFAISTTPRIAGGLTAAEVPQPDVSFTVGLKNLAYALQWWVFGLFALFMWWRMASEQVAHHEARVGSLTS